MIRVIIIDDVEKARIALRTDIEDYIEDMEIVGEAEGVESGTALIHAVQPQLVFLDIQMNDGTGFDLLKRFSAPEFRVIFTTALDNFAIKAFRFSALDYLLKPIDPDELVTAVARFRSELSRNKVPQDFGLLLENLTRGKEGPLKKIALHTQEKVFIINLEEVIRCQSDNNYTNFHLVNGRKILVTKTLKDFEKMLGDQGFIRPHQSHLVSLDKVSEFVKINGGYLVMSDGSEVPVSSRKREQILQNLFRA